MKFGKTAFALGLILCLAFFAGCISSTEESQGETIKVGVIAPLSGPSVTSGEPFMRGMNIALDEINNAGGVNGMKIELLVEDSKSTPQGGVDACNNLINLKEPDAIVPVLSSISVAVAPLAKENRIPMVATLALSANVTSEDNDWMFRYFTLPEAQTMPLVQIAEAMGFKKVAVLYLTDELGVSSYEVFRQRFSGEVVGESFIGSAGDFRTELTKLKAQNPDALYVVGYETHSVNAITQAKELGLNATIFATSIAAVPTARKALKDAGIEFYTAVPVTYNEDDEKVKAFKDKFLGLYGKEADHHSCIGYDTLYLIAKVVGSSGHSRDGIREGLSELDGFEGLDGSTDIEGKDFLIAYEPALVRDGTVYYL